MGNIVSSIHEEEDYQRKKHPRPNFDQIIEFKLDEVRQPAAWTRDREKLARRKARWEAKKKRRSDKDKEKKEWERAYEFLTSRALLQNDSDAIWQATDLLGAGAFGVVGLWQLVNKNGETIDELAIKETFDHDPKGYIHIFQRKDGLEPIPSEALWMDFLSRKTLYIPSIRRLVHFRGSNSLRWRFYMEYCPNGNLHDLIRIYKDYNETHDKSDE
jgi:hypothetical protein